MVIAILAIIGGGLLVAYDRLEQDAAEGQDSFNITAVERALHTFRVLNENYPDGLDSLLAGDASISPFAGDELDRLDNDLRARLLDTAALTAAELVALNAIGITAVRDVDTAGLDPYDNDNDFTDDNVTIANRIFDNTIIGSGFHGVLRPLIALDEVATVDTTTTLGTLLGLVATDKVVAFAVGNNSTIANRANEGALRQVPYSRVALGEYGRYVVLFQVSNAAGAFPEAQFITVLDAKGNTLDEAYAHFAD